MKISAWHKANGDQVWLNGVGKFDLTYGSWLFDFTEKVPCDIEGGPYFVETYGDNHQKGTRFTGRHNHSGTIQQVASMESVERLFRCETNEMYPDYSLFNLDYSLGYTFRFCPRLCPFCKVPNMYHKGDRSHDSIYSFHDKRYDKIRLLNNNTFADPQWKETFEEIWDANLTVIDENGYDLRFMDEEKADALRKTKFKGKIHYAWDLMKDERKILDGLMIAPKGIVYVLIGYNTTQEEDFYRCQKIHNLGHDPYIMPYNRTKQERRFQRFVNTRMYRRYSSIKEAWKDYK